jgi:hypothetical protein
MKILDHVSIAQGIISIQQFLTNCRSYVYEKYCGLKTMVKETKASEKIQGLGNCSHYQYLPKANYFALLQ